MALFNPNQRRPASPAGTRPPGRQIVTADPERQREVDAALQQDSDELHGRPSRTTTSGWAGTRGRSGGEESSSEAGAEAAPAARNRR